MYKEEFSTEEAMVGEAVQPVEKSAYEKERNKPMPNKIHGVLQTKISYLLIKGYGEKYLFSSEVTLATQPKTSTPDICIFPKKKLDLMAVEAKETEAPTTTIEIQSPTQSIDELQKKARDLYFPFGVKTAWIAIPALKAVQIITADNQQFFYNSGNLKDPETGIEISVEKIFEDLI